MAKKSKKELSLFGGDLFGEAIMGSFIASMKRGLIKDAKNAKKKFVLDTEEDGIYFISKVLDVTGPDKDFKEKSEDEKKGSIKYIVSVRGFKRVGSQLVFVLGKTMAIDFPLLHINLSDAKGIFGKMLKRLPGNLTPDTEVFVKGYSNFSSDVEFVWTENIELGNEKCKVSEDVYKVKDLWNHAKDILLGNIEKKSKPIAISDEQGEIKGLPGHEELLPAVEECKND